MTPAQDVFIEETISVLMVASFIWCLCRLFQFCRWCFVCRSRAESIELGTTAFAFFCLMDHYGFSHDSLLQWQVLVAINAVYASLLAANSEYFRRRLEAGEFEDDWYHNEDEDYD